MKSWLRQFTNTTSGSTAGSAREPWRIVSPLVKVYALMATAPMLNPQGKRQLAELRRQWQMLGSGRKSANILRAANQEGDLLEWDGENWVPVD